MITMIMRANWGCCNTKSTEESVAPLVSISTVESLKTIKSCEADMRECKKAKLKNTSSTGKKNIFNTLLPLESK